MKEYFDNLDDLFESINQNGINECKMEGELNVECPKCNTNITVDLANRKINCPNCGEEINIIFNME